MADIPSPTPAEIAAVDEYFAGGDVADVVSAWQETPDDQRDVFLAEIVYEAQTEWSTDLEKEAIRRVLDRYAEDAAVA